MHEAIQAAGFSTGEDIVGIVAAAYGFLARTPCALLIVQMEDLALEREQPNVPGTDDRHTELAAQALAQYRGNLRGAQHGRDPRRGSQGTAARLDMIRRSPFDTPLATYRLQLHREFTFAQATALLPYLARLGISHVYCSPFLKARAGSTHGYDVVDYGRINPELGDEASFARFCSSLGENGLGLILDFVPNHMGVGHADNAWWLDVLEWGQASPYAGYFDIDWSPPRRDLVGKLLVPILGKSYGAALTGWRDRATL